MELEKEECENATFVLEQTKEAIKINDALKLKELSNRTLHSSCFYQDAGSITASIIIYTLSKLIERQDNLKIKNWDKLIKRLNAILDLAILALQKNSSEAYAKYMLQARKTLEAMTPNLKLYIEEVLRKASINKASKLYEHGLSLSQTSQLLGITQWELAEYIGQRNITEKHAETLPIKERAKIALDFLSK